MINIILDKNLRCKRSDVVETPVEIYINNFTEATAKDFRDKIALANQTGQHVIPVYIDSSGGYCHAFLSMLDAVQNSNIPVATICNSKADSCGAFLFAMGHYRYMSKYARLLVHNISGYVGGGTEDIEAYGKYTRLLEDTIFSLVDKRCGNPKNYIRNLLSKKNNADLFVTPRQAIKHNWCDFIGSPTLTVKVSVNYEFA